MTDGLLRRLPIARQLGNELWNRDLHSDGQVSDPAGLTVTSVGHSPERDPNLDIKEGKIAAKPLCNGHGPIPSVVWTVPSGGMI